jgi:SAM-dependent methyltransferase
MNCLLCSSSAPLLSNANNKVYYKCGNCRLIFLDEKFFLSKDEERLRYQSHNNDPEDERYIRQLSKLNDKMIPLLKPGDTGLDYGCGKGKPISFILNKSGYEVSDYDPFFYDDKELLMEKQDFITCTETAEHFHKPGEDFALLNSILKPGGILGIMTNFYPDDINFDEWWYHRDPTHVSFYSKKTFEWLTEKFNWSILNIDEMDNVIIVQKFT